MSWDLYLHYDEDSLALHSNAGLIRRAKKSLDDVQLHEQHSTILQFKVEDCEVSLPDSGITQAQCNCPAQGCCKHILSSIFWLQQNAAQFSSDTASNTTETSPEKTPDTTDQTVNDGLNTTHQHTKSALDSALELKFLALFKLTGKANTRLAHEIWQQFCQKKPQQNNDECVIDLGQDKISFKTSLSEQAILFFPKTGLQGMLSDVPDTKKVAIHLACIAYLFHLHAPEQWQWSEELQSIHAKQNELNADDVVFIQELQQLCQQFIQQGLSHLAKESVLSLHILNMQARAQSLPRLAGLLHQLHGMMRQFLEHDIQVDEQQIFSQLAYLNCYLFALKEAQQDPNRFNRLKGSVQRNYQAEEIEHLIPLGCEWWQTDSGARGLTVTFWDVQAQQSREVTQARANYLDSTFDKNSVSNTGIWGTSLDYLLEHQIQLTNAKASTEVNLSASADTRFLQRASFNELKITDFATQQIGLERWTDLYQLLQPQSSLELNPYRYVLLRHQEISSPELNEHDQSFECRIQDIDGVQLKLTLPIEGEYQLRIQHLTTLINQNVQIYATLVRLDLRQQNVRLIPCSLIIEQQNKLQIFSLDYHYPRRKKNTLTELITGRIEKMLKQKKQWQQQENLSPLDATLRQTQALLEFYANTGRAVLDREDRQKLRLAAQHFEDLGLDLIHQSLVQGLDHPQLAMQLLKWRHVLLQLQRLLFKLPLEGQVMS